MSEGQKTPALQTQHLQVSLGRTQILKGINLALTQGVWTSVIGPNGAGKSTLLKALAGLLPSNGSIDLLGKPLAKWSKPERARAMSWLGQNEVAIDDLSVHDIVLLGRLPHQAWFSSASEQDYAIVKEALQLTQAWGWQERSLGSLSGGERQRVLLARALAVQAQVLLMDEPLTNLDPPHQSDWLTIVRTLVEQGKTVVSVLHEVSIALQAHEVVVMDQGQVLHHGANFEPATHRSVERVFNNRIRILQVEGNWIALSR
jgi:iron complex transport system ATP-binding protein